MYVVAFGDAFNGISLVGPFDSFESAELFVDGAEGPWNIVELDPPPDDELYEESDSDE